MRQCDAVYATCDSGDEETLSHVLANQHPGECQGRGVGVALWKISRIYTVTNVALRLIIARKTPCLLERPGNGRDNSSTTLDIPGVHALAPGLTYMTRAGNSQVVALLISTSFSRSSGQVKSGHSLEGKVTSCLRNVFSHQVNQQQTSQVTRSLERIKKGERHAKQRLSGQK
ncbi:hypothetical protein WMY93_012483 [Mugilogobius chulae]|uniref:Uncharacterized protein n=1 Tax=Mugilogobius chulae TaxID=88201 RepID=A0AAW0P553_9GOBI